MNFSTHKNKLIKSIKNALVNDKVQIIYGFKEILKNANDLLKTNKFDFWIAQIDQIQPEEIPVTRYGLNESMRLWSESQDIDRNSLKNLIEYTCENLFTYCDENDLCPLQSEYHYYFHNTKGIVFKESELGMTDLPNNEKVDPSDIRIAKVSELTIDRAKLLLAVNHCVDSDRENDAIFSFFAGIKQHLICICPVCFPVRSRRTL